MNFLAALQNFLDLLNLFAGKRRLFGCKETRRNMLMMGKCQKASCCRIISIVIPEEKTTTHSVMVAIFDDTKRGLGDKELFEVNL